MGFVNEPLDLNQVDKNSCLSCAVANILHVFGAGPCDWSWVDACIGRECGDYGSHARACALLASAGLSLHMVGEHDSERVLSEGLDYIRRVLRRRVDSCVGSALDSG